MANALDGIVVLDVAGPLGNYCGKLFSDMGADVILIEPPQGAPTRRQAPFVRNRQDEDASLTYQYQNTNKRSVILDLDTEQGQEQFRQLAAKASLIIESEAPAAMKARQLDYARLKERNPALVMASITPFGQTGPLAQWLGTDLTAMGMGGMLYLAGYPDTAPMMACGEQAVSAANVFAAVAAMASVLNAEATGQGQHIDVSMQESVVQGLENAVQFFDLEGTVRRRNGGTQRLAGTGVFECQDGYIYLMAGGIGSNRFWATSTQWLIDEGVEGAEQFQEARWNDQSFLASDEAKAIFLQVFTPYVINFTKAQLQQKGRERRIPIAPICDARDIAVNEQRAYRKFFAQTTDSFGTILKMPGAPYLLSETPWRLTHGAPKLGEHTQEVLRWAAQANGSHHTLKNEA